MHRSHQNVAPVANKYLDHKRFIKDQETHRQNLKTAQGLVDLSPPSPRSHCNERLRQKAVREYENQMIDHENDRLRRRMVANGAFVDSHNDFVIHSLNQEKRHRDEVEHKQELNRLQKQIKHIRSSYSTENYEKDYNKQLNYQRRITRYPSHENKK